MGLEPLNSTTCSQVACQRNWYIHNFIIISCVYSRLSLNGHLCLQNGHLELIPAFLYSFYLTLYKKDSSLRWTLSASPKGVRLRES